MTRENARCTPGTPPLLASHLASRSHPISSGRAVLRRYCCSHRKSDLCSGILCALVTKPHHTGQEANTRREAGKVWCARLARTPTIEGFQSDVIPREGPARRRGGAQDDMRTACVVTCTAAAARSDGVVDSCDYSSQLAVEGENRSESERSGVVGGVTVASSRGQPRCKERLKVGHNRNWHWTLDRLIGIL